MIVSILVRILVVVISILVYCKIGKFVNRLFSDKSELFLIFFWPIFVTVYIGMRIATKILGWRI